MDVARMVSMIERLPGNEYRDATYPAGIPTPSAMTTAPAAYTMEFRSSIPNVLWEKTLR
jgi:hypothetical protein